MVLWQSCRSDFKRIGFVQRSELCWTQTPQRKQCSSVVRAVKTVAFFCDWHAKGRVSKDMILPNKVGSALSKIAFLRAAPAVGSGRGQQATMKFAKLHQAAISFFYLWLRHHKAWFVAALPSTSQAWRSITQYNPSLGHSASEWQMIYQSTMIYLYNARWSHKLVETPTFLLASRFRESRVEPCRNSSNCDPEMYWLSEIQICNAASCAASARRL